MSLKNLFVLLLLSPVMLILAQECTETQRDSLGKIVMNHRAKYGSVLDKCVSYVTENPHSVCHNADCFEAIDVVTNI